jgi:putative transposase
MPRGNGYRLPGYVWHVTERCHRRQFLLKFARDRRAWVGWLYEARQCQRRTELSPLCRSEMSHVV